MNQAVRPSPKKQIKDVMNLFAYFNWNNQNNIYRFFSNSYPLFFAFTSSKKSPFQKRRERKNKIYVYECKHVKINTLIQDLLICFFLATFSNIVIELTAKARVTIREISTNRLIFISKYFFK